MSRVGEIPSIKVGKIGSHSINDGWRFLVPFAEMLHQWEFTHRINSEKVRFCSVFVSSRISNPIKTPTDVQFVSDEASTSAHFSQRRKTQTPSIDYPKYSFDPSSSWSSLLHFFGSHLQVPQAILWPRNLPLFVRWITLCAKNNVMRILKQNTSTVPRALVIRAEPLFHKR